MMAATSSDSVDRQRDMRELRVGGTIEHSIVVARFAIA
jgi:hypothetical protein